MSWTKQTTSSSSGGSSVTASTTNGHLNVNGSDITVYDDTEVRGEIANLSPVAGTSGGGAVYQANGKTPLKVPGPYGYKDQPMHPKVMYFSSRFAGYYYWMAYTPYTDTIDKYENPCIACSMDGVNWIVPIGMASPLLDSPTDTEVDQGIYFSDTSMTYRDDTKTLEVWYRKAINGKGQEIIYKRTTTDGQNWTAPQLMYQESNTGVNMLLSPALIWDNTNSKYRIWLVRNSSSVMYYESTDGTNWTQIRDTGLVGWHVDVALTDVGYEILVYVDGFGAASYLNHSVTTDTAAYSAPVKLMQGRGNGFWDAKLYRSSILKVGSQYRIYHSGCSASAGGKWGLGLSISSIDNDITSIVGVDSDYDMNPLPQTSIGLDLPQVNPWLKQIYKVMPLVSGATTDRRQFIPNDVTYNGLCWFDTNLGKPFWLKKATMPTQWVDGTGTLESYTDQPPVISQNIANVNMTIGTVTYVQFTATDDYTLPTFSYSIDGGTTYTNYNPIISTTRDTYYWKIPSSLVAGTYQCKLGAKDNSQQWSYSNTFTLTISQ